MRAPAVAALSLTLISCEQSFPLPPGAQLSCTVSSECPSPLLCDPELERCVDSIVPTPDLTLAVDRTEGSRADDFTFTSTSPDSALSYRWELLDDATGTARVLVAEGTARLVHRFSFERTEFCPADAGCKSALARTVRLTVTNAGGKHTARQASVVIKNAAPIAHFGEDLFISEEGVPEVELDLCGGVRLDGGCTTRDPDGDPISFDGFQQVGGPPVTLRDAGLHRVRFTPPAGWQQPLLFQGVVGDGLESATGTVRVYRGAHAWVNAGLLDQTWRLHPDFRAVTGWTRAGAGSPFYSPEALVSDGVGGWWFGDSDPTAGSTLVVHLDRNLNELERWEEANNASASFETVPSLVPPRGAVPGCLVYRHFGAGSVADAQSGFVRFTTGPSQVTIKHSRPLTTLGTVRLPLAVLPVGTTGDCWAIGHGPDGAPSLNAVGGELGKLQADGTWVPVATLTGFPHAWAAEAGGTLWIAERFPIPTADGGFAAPNLSRYRTELRRFTAAGASSTIEVGGRFLAQVAAHPRGGLWALDAAARGLVRVWPDGSTTASATPPLGATTVFASNGLAVDPAGAAVWVTDALADQLYRFEEAPDGGLTVAGVTGAEELPEGPNRKGFTGRVAVDPLTGGAASFVGSLPNLYARWVSIPPHVKRRERSGWSALEQSRLRGDPASGHVWLTTTGVLRRLDIGGRPLVEVPNVWEPGVAGTAPLIVDRRGRAWVATTDGLPALRVIDTDGLEVQRVPLPFNPADLSVAGSMQNNGPRETACAVSRMTGEVVRLDLAGAAVQPLSVPLQSDGGVITPYLCAPTSSGRVWVLANQYLDSSKRPHLALLYEPGVTSPGAPIVARATLPTEDGIQVTGAGADDATGDLFFTTWEFPTYSSELIRVGVGGSVSTVRMLQGLGAVGIGLSVKPRRVCPQLVPSCVELWVNNRLSELHRYDLQGTDLEGFVFGRVEPQFDLVP